MGNTLRFESENYESIAGFGPEHDFVPSRDREEFVIPRRPLTGLLQEIVKKGSSARLRAAGHSMIPFIREEDVLTISPTAAGDLKLGDIVVFEHPGQDKLVIHRIIKTIDDACLVRGDCCYEPDGFILKKNILGRVSRIERRGRSIRLSLGSGKYLIAFLSAKSILWRLGNLISRVFLIKRAGLRRF